MFLFYFLKKETKEEYECWKSEAKTNLACWFCFVQFSKLKGNERIFMKMKKLYVCSFVDVVKKNMPGTGRVEIERNERWTEKDR